jgi:DNA (cytosine-5)-methyltransferase 1
MNKEKKTYIDLFAGAGGLSEGFIQAGFEAIAHVEIDKAASNTLKTRMARHWLADSDNYMVYEDYLHEKITRNELWSSVPQSVLNTVLNLGIGKDTNAIIFDKINEFSNSKSVDLIIGGPPCQAYSIAGRSRDKNGMVGDDRNYLYKDYAKFLKRYKPQYFVFENVLGLLSAKDKDGTSYFDKMKQLFKKTGYEVEHKVLDSSKYGIPQKRKRIILIGKYGEKPLYPEPDKCVFPLTISDYLIDLPFLSAGSGQYSPQEYKAKPHSHLKTIKVRNSVDYVTWHISRPNQDRDLEIYKIAAKKMANSNIRLSYNELPERLITHKNRKAHLDRFKVVAGNLNYSHTVVAHISKDGHYYIHPDFKQNRSLTPREAARLQTFPDDYFFESISEKSGRTAAFKQIGNAVPVLLAKKIALKLEEYW